MVDEPDNLVLEILRGMRGDINNMRDGLVSVREGLSEVREGLHDVREDIRGLRRVQDQHTLRFDFLEERVERLRDSTMMALGYAVDANERKKRFEAQLGELTERVEKLEKAK